MGLDRRVSRRRLLVMAGAAGVVGRLGMGARAVARERTEDPAVVGRWDPPFPGPPRDVAVHAVLLRTGKVLLFYGNPLAHVWDPVTGEIVQVDVPRAVFCAGQAVLPDGRVLVVGGIHPGQAQSGPPWVYTFDPDALTWTRWADMRQGRYYPSVTILPDGRALITNGKTADGGHSFNEDLEVFDPVTNALSLVGTQKVGLYAHQWLMPDGRVLVAGPRQADSMLIDPATWTVTPLPPLTAPRTHAGGFLVPGGPDGSWKVMLTGGKQEPSTETIDLAADPLWRRAPRLPTGRAHMNTVLLPDGTVLGIGGDSGEVSQPERADRGTAGVVCTLSGALLEQVPRSGPDTPERQTLLFDPAAGTWRAMATQTEARAYHSTALLLPDGRVLSAGGTGEGSGLDRLELYSPPYLFRGARPSITSAPATIAYATEFRLATSAPCSRAVLLRPGATTHTNDMDQRHVELRVLPKTLGLNVLAPPDARVAPPGHYLLFVLDAAGVPSVASWVRLA